ADLRMRVAQKTLAGPGRDGVDAYQRQLTEWTSATEKLEEEIAGLIPEMNLEQTLRKADRRAVALALPEGVALVEFVRFPVLDFKAVPGKGEPMWRPARYLAFVLPAGGGNAVQMVDLGEAEPIEQWIVAFRARMTVPPGRRPRPKTVKADSDEPDRDAP